MNTSHRFLVAMLPAVASLAACSGAGSSAHALPPSPAIRQAPDRGTALVRLTGATAPRLRSDATVLQPIADEALQTGHAYPRRESWHYSGIDPSCGKIEWSYVNKIPNVTVTLEPHETPVDGETVVSFSEIPNDAATALVHQQVVGACSNPNATGTVPTPTDYTIYVVSLDVGRVAQAKGDPTVVTGTTFDAIVGQFVELSAVSDPKDLRSTTWKPLSNDVVASYNETKDSATYDPFNPSDYLKDSIRFYWVHGGDGAQDLRIDAVFPVFATHCDPTRCTGKEDKWGAADAEAKANVLAPSGVSLNSKTGLVSVSKDPSVGCAVALHFGVPEPKCAPGVTKGILWSFKATAPAGGAGDFDATQIIQRTASATNLPRTTSHIQPSQTNGKALDGCVQYGTGSRRHQQVGSGSTAIWTSSDSPFLSLFPGWKSVTDADTFRTYFVYKPSDDPRAPPERANIWVPLGHLDWNWKSAAKNAGSGTKPNWGLASSDNSRDPKGAAARDDLPTWNQLFTSSDLTCAH